MYEDRPEIKARLGDELVAWMTTVSADGQPQPSVVWFVVDDDVIVIYSKEGTPRLRNIAVNPRVSLHLNSDRDGASPLVIEGEAQIMGTERPFDQHPGYFAKYEPHLARWDFTIESYAREFTTRIHVRPTRLRAG
jgi:PPOX class probable F420-dependent enzyme